jgi:5-methylthioadenosine/S-adenosylhomocysteine deaminase
VQIHLHESSGEIEEALAQTGKRPFDRLAELGLVNASLLAVHAVHLTDNEIGAFAAAGVSVAHCPRSNLKLADGIARVHELQSAGINVALGTDGAASNNVLDMLGEMRAAALLAKVRANDATALPAADALRMATLDGARSIGLDQQVGSLVAGKWADITCIDLRRLNSQPLYDPLSQVVYTANAEQVRDVWIAGRHQVENGQLTHIDEDELLNRAAEWQSRISSARK